MCPSLAPQELFDFARASSLAPGATVTLYFTLPPLVAATVSDAGVQALTPGSYTVRIGDVPGPHASAPPAAGARARWVEGRAVLLGEAPVPIR